MSSGFTLEMSVEIFKSVIVLVIFVIRLIIAGSSGEEAISVAPGNADYD